METIQSICRELSTQFSGLFFIHIFPGLNVPKSRISYMKIWEPYNPKLSDT